jgi:hypothetical protein
LEEKEVISAQTLSRRRKVPALCDDIRDLNASPNVNIFNGLCK